jgi:glutamine amidotransferase
MCRFTAYSGPEIPIERIVVRPKHSLLEQSQNATEAKLAVNGDGFGLAWYGQGPTPGLYRDVLPAWSDGNLTNLCRMVQAGLFLAHVRASTQGETARANCHPFVFGKWSFMHNGKMGGFKAIRRQLEASLSDALYLARRGTTDSELLFYLLLSNGLDESPKGAVEETLRQIEAAQSDCREPNRFACAFSDGADIYGFRSSSDSKSPSLYVGKSLDSGGCVLASEPLDDTNERWTAIPEHSFLVLGQGNSPLDLPPRA